MVHGGDDGEIGAIKAHIEPAFSEAHSVVACPALPLITIGVIPPGLPIVQQPTVLQVAGILQQVVLHGIFGAANRHYVLIHQMVDGEPLRYLLIEVEGQIDAITVQIDVLVAGYNVQLDLGMQS